MDQETTQLDGVVSTGSDTELLRAGLRAIELVESQGIVLGPALLSTPPDARLAWEKVWVRVLVPFTFRLDTDGKAQTGFDWLARAGQALDEAAEARVQPWKRATKYAPGSALELHVHADYTCDYYDHVSRFLFGDGEPTQTGCAAWRIDPNEIARWLRNTSLVVTRGTGAKSVSDIERGWLAGRERWPVKAIDDSGAELFLSQMGAGVLSISLEVLPPVQAAPSEHAEPAAPHVSVLASLLHALATGQKAVWFCRHAFDGYEREPDGGGRLPMFEERLHGNTHAFSFPELVSWMLQPLSDNGLDYEPESRNMANITVEVPYGRSLEEAVTRGQALSELAQLSQFHTTTHPGEMTGESHSVPIVINRTHVASMSLSGVAHAVAREIPSAGAVNPYDITHLRRAHFEYFLAWLVPVIQRLALRQSIGRSVRLVHLRRQAACRAEKLRHERKLLKEERRKLVNERSNFAKWLQGLLPGVSDHAITERLQVNRNGQKEVRGQLQRFRRNWSGLRSQLLDFSLQGEFVQVSPRSTVQHFYEKAQEATQVPAALTKIRNAITDRDNAQRADDSAEMARKATTSIKAIKHMHGNLEWVEILILGACAIEVVHYLSDHRLAVMLALLLLGLVGVYAAIRIFRPEKHAPLDQRTLLPTLVLLFVVATLLAFLLWRESGIKEREKTSDPGGKKVSLIRPGPAIRPIHHV